MMLRLEFIGFNKMQEHSSQRDKLVTCIMKRKYEKQGVTLPVKYWNLPQYKEEYQHQMRAAAKIIRAYDMEAVWNVINKEKWCWSLHAKQLHTLFEKEQANLSKQRIAISQIEQLNIKEEEEVKKPLFRKKDSGQKK